MLSGKKNDFLGQIKILKSSLKWFLTKWKNEKDQLYDWLIIFVHKIITSGFFNTWV